MRIEGRLVKSEGWWSVEIPLLFLYTQGKTKKEAYEMAKDAVETMLDDIDSNFEATVYPEKGNIFSIGCNNEALLLAFALKQNRDYRDLSIREIAKRLGSNSPTAYSRYEQGRVKPSLDKFTELLEAIDKDLTPIIRIAHT